MTIELLHTRKLTHPAWVATQIRTTQNGNNANVDAMYIAFENTDNYLAILLFAQQVYISHKKKQTSKPENDFHMQSLKSNNFKM